MLAFFFFFFQKIYKFLEENPHLLLLLGSYSASPEERGREIAGAFGKPSRSVSWVLALRVCVWWGGGLGRRPRPLCPLPLASLLGPHLEPPQERSCLRHQGGGRPRGWEEEPERNGVPVCSTVSYFGRRGAGRKRESHRAHPEGVLMGAAGRTWSSRTRHRLSRPLNVSVPTVLLSWRPLP